jgi:hypothetical protein
MFCGYTRFTYVQPNSTHQEVLRSDLRAFDAVESRGPHRSRFSSLLLSRVSVAPGPPSIFFAGKYCGSWANWREKARWRERSGSWANLRERRAGELRKRRASARCVMGPHDQRGPFGGFAAGPALRLCAAALLLTASCNCARSIHRPCSARPLCSYNLRLRGGMPKVSLQRRRGNTPALCMYGAAGLCQITSGRVWEGLARRQALLSLSLTGMRSVTEKP